MATYRFFTESPPGAFTSRIVAAFGFRASAGGLTGETACGARTVTPLYERDAVRHAHRCWCGRGEET